MNDKTLKELRDLAKARGLKGYSKLTKDELVRQLERRQTETQAAPTAAVQKPVKTERRRTPTHAAKPEAPVAEEAPAVKAAAPAAVAPAAPAPPATPETVLPSPFASSEQRVEDAKYALRPNGRSALAPAADLGEDIDRLPALAESVVCLLPQKPGILHAYWVLPPGETAARGDYRLRLCQTARETLQVHEEVPVQSDRGDWYFHIGEPSAHTTLLVQLGYYENGRFVSARGRSIARVPSLYASTRTDQRWWVSEADFMHMYRRAGGMITPARRFGWSASIGSPGGAPPSEQFMLWPGGVSSPPK